MGFLPDVTGAQFTEMGLQRTIADFDKPEFIPLILNAIQKERERQGSDYVTAEDVALRKYLVCTYEDEGVAARARVQIRAHAQGAAIRLREQAEGNLVSMGFSRML